MNYIKLCRQILEIDSAISFAGAATVEGDILAAEYRDDNTVPLLTTQESELAIMQSALRTSMRKTLASKFGRTIYTFAEYEKVKRATFVLYDEKTLKCESILKLTIDKDADHNRILENEVKPILGQVGKAL